MNANDLKLRAWAWIQANVDPGAEFRTVRLRKGLRLTSDRSRARLTYALFCLIKAGMLERAARRKQTYRLVPYAPVAVASVTAPEPPPFLQMLAFIIGHLVGAGVQFVRTADLFKAIAEHFGADARLLQNKTPWQQSYCWAMHRLKRRGWIIDWGSTRIAVSPALHVDLHQSGDHQSVAAWLERWWREYEAVALKPSRGPNLLSAITS